MTPQQIAAALARLRAGKRANGRAVALALADAVERWVAATKEHDAIHSGLYRRRNPTTREQDMAALEARDDAEIRLAKAVKR